MPGMRRSGRACVDLQAAAPVGVSYARSSTVTRRVYTSQRGPGLRYGLLPMAEAVQLVRILGGATAVRHQRGEAVLRAGTRRPRPWTVASPRKVL